MANPAPNPNCVAIPRPLANVGALAAATVALKKNVDSLTGNGGSPTARAVTFDDMIRMGLITQAAAQSATGQGNAAPQAQTFITDTDQTRLGGVDWDKLPTQARSIVLPFNFRGLPPSNAVASLFIPQTMTIQAELVVIGSGSAGQIWGSGGAAGALATAPAVFTVSYRRGATDTDIGQITFHPDGTVTTAAAVQKVDLVSGDLLRVIAPAVQDATLTDVAISVVALRV